MSKAQNDIPSAKREGDDMAKDVRNVIQLDENVSSKRATTTLRQETLLDELEKAFDEDEESVVAKFDELRAECILVLGDCGLILVIKVERVRINVIADVLSLPKPVSVWENFLPSKDVLSLPALSLHN